MKQKFERIGEHFYKRICNPFSLAATSPARVRHEPITHLGRIQQLSVLIVTDNNRIKWIVWHVSTNDKLLPLVDAILEPCTTSLAGFVAEGLALSHDSFKLELFGHSDKVCRRGVHRLGQTDGTSVL